MSRCSRRSTIVPADRLRPEAEAELSPLPVDQEQAFEVQSINNQRTKCSKQNAQAESPWCLIDLRDLRIRHKLRQTKNVSSRIPRLRPGHLPESPPGHLHALSLPVQRVPPRGVTAPRRSHQGVVKGMEFVPRHCLPRQADLSTVPRPASARAVAGWLPAEQKALPECPGRDRPATRRAGPGRPAAPRR